MERSLPFSNVERSCCRCSVNRRRVCMPEIVYVFTNPAMPNYIKIGMTKRAELEMRLKELSRHVGVPEPFELVYAVEVDDARKVESALKEAFVEFRSSKRHSEFFKMKPAPIIAILKAIAKAEVSVMVQNKLDQHVTSVKSKTTTKNSRRGDRFSFGLAEIPVGARLHTKTINRKNARSSMTRKSNTKASFTHFRDSLNGSKEKPVAKEKNLTERRTFCTAASY